MLKRASHTNFRYRFYSILILYTGNNQKYYKMENKYAFFEEFLDFCYAKIS